MAFLINNWKTIAIAAAVFLAFLGGWLANGWRYSARIADMKTAYEEALVKATTDAMRQHEQHAATIADIDYKYTRELNHAKEVIDRLNANLDAGGLRVNAECSADLPKADTGARVDNAATPRLTDAARRNYFTLRTRIEEVTAQLRACQDVIRSDRE